ncbi:hypothetical protein FUA23_19545 [Neolewinella aurantiaca]|uniref:PD-(D/E)XK nuclease superfamily protein n=1 Tax=Neolewinella aurantiaca TaxID=2602767 RepID=A0A5C7FNM1_9BACT|nr:hypothetical protein [Neolewinella aurantiaca]TXF86315.1 hypothetical protein FUA23_19545 [Neolewinella aurantiaca]
MNHHLNLFTFFNDSKAEHLENNLSRAFALCLLHDPLFLDRVLGKVLTAEDYQLLSQESWTSRDIDIDVQLVASSFEGYRKLYAVGASPQEMNIELIDEYAAGGAADPVTDVSVALGDILIIFEFKVSRVDPGQQLKGQAEAISRFGTADPPEVVYADFNWGKIIAVAESVLGFMGKLGTGSALTRDFVQLLESRYAEWFPPRPMNRVAFPASDASSEFKQLHQRLNLIKEELAKAGGYGFETYKGTYARTVLRVNWGWTREVLIDFTSGTEDKYIRLAIYAGETKRQGWELFGKGLSFDQLTSPVAGATLVVRPYLKFRHFNSAIAELFLSPEESRRTHTLEFHTRRAGRYPKERWPELEAVLTDHLPGWRSQCAYDAQVTESNRSYVDFSAGVLLELLIPYEEAERHDTGKPERAVAFFRKCIDGMREMVELKNGNHE